MKLSTIASNIPASPIRYLVPFALDAKKKGTHIYHLNIGDPDVESPDAMIDFLKSWSRNPVGYAHSQGEAEFIESLQGYYGGLGYDFLKPKNIQVTLGGSEGLMWTFMSICEPRDEIIAFEPFYTNYNSYAVMTGINIKPVTSKIEDDFHLPKAEDIEKLIGDRTRGILLCNPSNPTGTVYTKEEVEMIVEIAKKHNLYVISDEVYREFVYGGRKAVSMLDYAKDLPEQVIVVDSLSKRYSMCGARLGCIVSLNTDLMAAVLKFGQARLSAGLIDQLMAAELKNVPQSYYDDMIAEYDRRQKILVKGLRSIDGVLCSEPEGAFYVVVKLPVDDAADYAKWLLTDFALDGAGPDGQPATVMVAPMAGFYSTQGLGKDEVRIAYVLHEGALEKSVEIIKESLKKY